ncbi:septum formation initiator family protein [bacterium]|nr:septum formation initiator family protein [bacterium]
MAVKKKQRWRLYAAIVLVCILVVVLVFNKHGGLLQVLELQKERNQLRHQVQQLQAEKTTLQEQIKQLQEQDPLMIESEARRLGMAREGEEIFILEYEASEDTLRTESGDR